MLNSVVHGILNACEYKNIKKFGLFSPLIHVFTFISGENFILSRVEHEKSFITSGPDVDTFAVRPEVDLGGLLRRFLEYSLVFELQGKAHRIGRVPCLHLVGLSSHDMSSVPQHFKMTDALIGSR